MFESALDLISGEFAADADVVEDRSVKQFNATNEGGSRTKLAQRKVADVNTVEFDGEAGEAGVAGEGVEECAFSRAADAAQGNLFARGDGEVEVGGANDNGDRGVVRWMQFSGCFAGEIGEGSELVKRG